MTGNNPNLDLVSINVAFIMHIQNLVKFCQIVHKILRGNKIMTEGGYDGGTDRQNDERSKSSIAPLF